LGFFHVFTVSLVEGFLPEAEARRPIDRSVSKHKTLYILDLSSAIRACELRNQKVESGDTFVYEDEVF